MSDTHDNRSDSGESEGSEVIPRGPSSEHPLQNTWVLWFDKRQNGPRGPRGQADAFESNLKEVGRFTTVEDFWTLFKYLKKASKIEFYANYHMFKLGVKPMWEDDANKEGGKWVVQVRQMDGFNVDSIWENLLLAMIGEQFEHSEELCGAVFSRRRASDKIALWTSDKTNEEHVMSIGKDFRKSVGLDGKKAAFEYIHHVESLKSQSSYTGQSKALTL